MRKWTSQNQIEQFHPSRNPPKMLHLMVFLLGSLAVAAVTGYGAWQRDLIHQPMPTASIWDKELIKVHEPSTDLNFSDLDLHSLNLYTFPNCESVRSLDLSMNWLSELPPGVFATMTNLEHLSLAWNELDSEAMAGAFATLANLKSLDLTHNPLDRTLKRGTFVGLPNSCEIHVGKSRYLRTIVPRAFGRIKEYQPRNHTFAGESKDCPDRLDDRIESFEVERSWIHFGKGHEDRHRLNDEPYSDGDVKMCVDTHTVTFVDFANVTDTRSPNCRTILMNSNGTKLKIYDDTVTSFGRGWFRIRNTSVNAVYVYPNSFENLTGDLLNDLPENIGFFSLQNSDLERLHRGAMINEHLRGLDLSSNFIRSIEDEAFAGLKLTRLNLGYNPLVNLDYVPTLPDTLLWLNLDFTGVLEIPANTFSHLKSLLALSLSGNSILELQPPGLDGLVSLQWLDLALARVNGLRPGVFRDLSRLHGMDLSTNNLTLDRGVFAGLGCLAKLDLRWNRLTRLGPGAFDGLTDRLEALDMRENRLEVLESGTFVGVPKYNLTLESNRIRKIEKDAFDLPHLRYLDLRRNDLTTIERGAVRSLGNLAPKTEIRLGSNPIERLENGALAGVSANARVSLAQTPVKVIQAGVFDDS